VDCKHLSLIYIVDAKTYVFSNYGAIYALWGRETANIKGLKEVGGMCRYIECK
jgi:hypothetical protein